MIRPTYTTFAAPSGLSFDDFCTDAPLRREAEHVAAHETVIDGVTVTPQIVNSDPRGSLIELLTTRDGTIEPIVHVYQVTALPGSIRAWVYHRRQFDRLAFGNGRFEVVLYDIRPGSPTINRLAVFTLGSEQPARLRIPPLVIHGVMNIGSETATFVNMPTLAYDPSEPDKCRLAEDDPRIPYKFDAR
jgi:dTDP-4-dehydrorhamnose 3,5-epimerase